MRWLSLDLGRYVHVYIFFKHEESLEKKGRACDCKGDLSKNRTLLSGSGVVRRITPPGRRRARRGGPCPGTGRCARTRRKRGRAAASPARRRGAVAARSAAATRPPPWC